jgi:hypothetical protein
MLRHFDCFYLELRSMCSRRLEQLRTREADAVAEDEEEVVHVATGTRNDQG